MSYRWTALLNKSTQNYSSWLAQNMSELALSMFERALSMFEQVEYRPLWVAARMYLLRGNLRKLAREQWAAQECNLAGARNRAAGKCLSHNVMIGTF